MAYLPSGTVYPSFSTSAYQPGIASEGRDYVISTYSSAASLAVSGVSQPINTSLISHNYSGTAAYVITPGVTPAAFTVVDAAGKAASATITISGASTQIVNGTSGNTVTLTTAYGSRTGRQVSANVWVVS